ncbi:O-Antigen ligase [Botrimarina mediterranea]|uniref:O-Antigen ligase n=1 Tax=Botrimarina mediterranea TaxID=2528022 RepID=A0A518KBK5_9BACT|nr:O-Antigen ligase [Botrimarina mediterranea]
MTIAGLMHRVTLIRWCSVQSRQTALDLTLVVGLGLTLLALGGRHDGGCLVYVATVALATLLTVLNSAGAGRTIRVQKGPLLLGIAALACVVVQLVPLPVGLLNALAPGHASLLPLWSEESPLGRWTRVSLAPPETFEGLAVLVSHCLLFFVVAERVRSEGDVKKVLGCVAVASVVLAIIGVVQAGFPDGRLLWMYDYPSRSFKGQVQGAFANRNHFAHFLIFGLASLAPFAFQRSIRAKGSTALGSEKTRRIVCLGAMIFVVVILVATQSRGGVAAFGVALLVAVIGCWWRRLVGLKETLLLAAMASVVLLGVSLFDYEKVTNRLNDLVSGEIEELDANAGRRLIWGANARAFLANPWLGHGAGSHRYVYPAYIDGSSAREFTHAESGYFQIASENGAAGLLVLAAAAAMVVRTLLCGLRRAASPNGVLLQAVLMAGIAASFAHSVVDFVWYVPSLAMLAIIFAACATRLEQLHPVGKLNESAPPQLSRANGAPISSWFPAAVAVTAGALAVAISWGPGLGSLAWDRYLRASKTTQSLEASLLTSATEEGDPHLLATIDETIRRAVNELLMVVENDPQNARAHTRLAGRLMQQFESAVMQGENPLSIEMIADTVTSGGFQSKAEVRDWLARAFGEDALLLPRALEHAQAAIRLCPLQGETYLQATRLSFLDADPLPLGGAIAQAVRLQPNDGGVRFDAGRQIHLSGDVEAALEHYRASIRLPGSHRERLVLSLARVLPASVFVAELDPDCAATDLVLAAYRQSGTDEDLVAIAEHAEGSTLAESEALSPRDSARRWRQVSVVNRSLKRYEKAIECATRAYELCPNDFWVRFDLAFAYFDSGAFVEADPHLRWCLSRRPDLRHLQSSLQAAAKRRLEMASGERMRTVSRFLAPRRLPIVESDAHSSPETVAR